MEWHIHPVLSAALAAAAAAYLVGVTRLARRSAHAGGHDAMRGRRHGAAWPRRRTAAFLAGVAAVAATLQSGLDSHATELLSVHMVQHLVVTLVAPPLLLLGAPVTLALRALPHSARAPLAAVVTSRLARTLAHPLVAWPLFTGVLVATHLSPFYDAALRSEFLHGLEHGLYLGSALLFWTPLVGGDPAPRPRQPAVSVLYLLLAMPPMALVGVTLLSASTVRYPAYLEPAAALGLSALADQQAAGTIMWLGGSFALVAATVAVGWAALLREERRALAREGYEDEGRLSMTAGRRR